MVSTLYNDPQRYILDRVYTILLENDIISQLFSAPEIPANGDQIREVQFGLAKHNESAYIAETLEYFPESLDIVEGKARKYYVQKDLKLNQEQYKQTVGPRGQMKELMARLFAYDIMMAAERYITIGDTTSINHGFTNALLGLNADASDAIGKPATCEGTAGTAETGSSWAGGNRGTECVTDIIVLLKDLAVDGFVKRRNGLTFDFNTAHIFIHSLAWAWVKDWPIYDGVQYSDDTVETRLAKGRYTVVNCDAIDYDYAGADDGTTQIALAIDIKDNFAVLPMEPLRQMPWEREGHTFNWWSKMYEGRIHFAIPKYNGTDYKKAVAQSTIIPYDSAA